MKCPVCDFDLRIRHAKPRSTSQHRRYWAMITAAFHHWPEGRGEFATVDELRQWLQMRAGHREIGAQIPIKGMSAEQAKTLAAAVIAGTDGYGVPVIWAGTLVIFRPKSIAFEKLKHEDACRLFDAVAAFIEDAVGFSVDQLLKEHERAA